MSTIDDIIFVSFEPGNGGHRMARTIASLPEVHWYSNKDNGINPWNTHFEHTNIRQRYVAAKHFDRVTPYGTLPPTFDYAAGFFDDSDAYYNDIFLPKFNTIAKHLDKKIIYCTHSTPKQLQRYFPNSKIINVIPSDNIVDRYLRTTAKFPGWLRLEGIVPEDNEWLVVLRKYKAEKPGFTKADLWAQYFFHDWYVDDYENLYRNYLTALQNAARRQRSQPYENTINVTGKPDWKSIKAFLRH